MRSFLSILVAAAISAQAISKLVILVNFQLNKEYIAKNLCEKKEEEDNCCQGSCHLKKQLAEDEERNNEATNAGKLKLEKSEYCGAFIKLGLFKNTRLQINSNYSDPTSLGFRSSLFRPPCAAV